MTDPLGRVGGISAPLTLDEYLALPDDARCEIVDGIVRPMPHPRNVHRQVQRRLTTLIEEQCPPEYLAVHEEIVVLRETPAAARIPNVSVFARTGKVRRTNHVAARHVLLVVEVVSEGSGDQDRRVKPGEYARNGIPHYWRIELEPEIAVHTYVLADGVYVRAGVFGLGDRIKSVSISLGWVDIPVDRLVSVR